MEKSNILVVFWIDNQQFAFHLSRVERIIRIVEISPLPKAPEFILGTLNFHGDFLPVINFRKIFSIPERDISLNDQLIIINTHEKKIAVWVDIVSDIINRENEDIIKSENILLDEEYIEGAFKLDDGIVLLHDIDKFLKSEQNIFPKESIEEKNLRKKKFFKSPKIITRKKKQVKTIKPVEI